MSLSWGWGAYAWDKIPQQEFAVKKKMQAGLMREGWCHLLAGHYGITFIKFLLLSLHTQLRHYILLAQKRTLAQDKYSN